MNEKKKIKKDKCRYNDKENIKKRFNNKNIPHNDEFYNQKKDAIISFRF